MLTWPLAYILAPLTVVIAGFLAWQCRRLQPLHTAAAGLLAAFTGLTLSIGVWFDHAGSIPSPTGPRPAIWKDGRGQVMLASELPGPVQPFVRLDVAGPPIDQIIDRGGKAWILLDGSRGIRPEFHEWVTKHFGEVKDLGGPKSVTTPVCWTRSPQFPFASGRCSERQARHFVPTSQFDLARTPDGKSVASIRLHKGRTIALVLHSTPAAHSPEEGCLSALAQGSACAAIELLPSSTLSVLAVKPADQAQARILREFDIPRMDETDEALSIYEDEAPLEMGTIGDSAGPHICGGMLENGFLHAIRLEKLAAKLQVVRGESDISRAVELLDEYRNCPLLSILELPPLQMRREQASLRSLLTQIRERPLWITHPKSVRARIRKLAQSRLEWNSADATLWVRPGSRIDRFAVTVMTHHPLSDGDIAKVSISDTSVSMHVHRLNNSSFRVSFDSVAEPFGVGFSREIVSASAKPGSVFLDWTGFATAALVGFLIAGLTTLFQSLVTVPHRWRPFFPGTFTAVFLVTFVWVFLSYRAALVPTETRTSVAGVERPFAPRHVFLRDWPESWFLGEPVAGSAAGTKDAWARWATLLTNARDEAKLQQASRPGRVQLLQVARIARTPIPASSTVAIWDDPRARNWHFRRSPDYRTSVTAWEDLFRRRDLSSTFLGEGTLDSVLARGPQVLIIPDARFLEAVDSTKLDHWVREGNTLVVSEGPTAGAPVPSAAAWIQVSGLGRARPQNFSRAVLNSGARLEINFPHRVVSMPSRAWNLWYGSSTHGNGRVFYVGLAPVNQGAQKLLASWIEGILGDDIVVAPTERACTSTVLLHPWGAPLDRIRAFAQSMRSRGVRFQWLLDPISFAQMMPSWEKEFRQDGVVFSDDGTRVSRELARILWNYSRPASDDLVFARQQDSIGTVIDSRATEQGPDGSFLMNLSVFPGSDGFEAAVRSWKAECIFGAADPRLIDPTWISTSPNAEGLLRALQMPGTSFVAAAEGARVLLSLQHNEPGSRTRRLSPDPLHPLQLNDPRASARAR